MTATIKQFLAPGRALVAGDKDEQYRVSVPVNRLNIGVGSKIEIKSPRDVVKKLGVTERVGDKSTIVVKDVKFKEADLVLS